MSIASMALASAAKETLHDKNAEIAKLKERIEWLGEMAMVCVGLDLGRRCSYCRCDGKNLISQPLSDA